MVVAQVVGHLPGKCEAKFKPWYHKKRENKKERKKPEIC
jgi:predicted ribonuclease YlaK